MNPRAWPRSARARALGLLVMALVLLMACRVPRRITIVIGPTATPVPSPGAGSPQPPTAMAARTPSPSAAATPPPAVAGVGSPSPTATATPSPTVVHQVTPGEPRYAERLWDATCEQSATQGPPIVPLRGDDYFVNLYERPFDPETQANYAPELDIRRADIGSDGEWVYVTLELVGPPPQGQPTGVAYGVELDLDLDGRGEWLLWAHAPLSTQWQVAGVRLFHDTNDDVGQARACRADPPQRGDSYDALVFDAGQGPDPDAAWVRWVPKARPQVQFALHYPVIDRDPAFMWWVWADRGVDQPTWMDYHDHFRPEEAGSPFPNNRYYPAKAVAQVDNTCHWVFGFQPTGDEPCICAGNFPTRTPSPTPTFTPTPPPPKARIVGYFCKDRNDNKTCDPATEGVSSVGVALHYGPCGSPRGVYATAVSGPDGKFVIEAPPGVWCLIPDRNLWEPARQVVSISPGVTSVGPFYFMYRP